MMVSLRSPQSSLADVRDNQFGPSGSHICWLGKAPLTHVDPSNRLDADTRACNCKLVPLLGVGSSMGESEDLSGRLGRDTWLRIWHQVPSAFGLAQVSGVSYCEEVTVS